MTAIDNLLASVQKTASTSSKFDALLDAETRKTLDEFVEHLAQTKTQATARSYRSYVAKALALQTPWPEMSSDTRSAVRAFAKFMNA